MNATTVAPPPGGDQNLGPAVLAVVWTEIGVCTIAIALRFWSRHLIHNIGLDDWLMSLSYALFVAIGALVSAQNSLGGYRHTYYLSQHNIIAALELNFILRALAILSAIPGKAAVGVLILRLTTSRQSWQRWVIWITLAFVVVISVLNVIFNFVQCSPVQANWDYTLKATANCWPAATQLDFAYFTAAVSVVTDVILAILPLTFIIKLRMSARKRLYACIVMGLGLMAAVCGSVKTYELGSIGKTTDFTYGEYGLTVWVASETFVIIFCGSIPTFLPAIRWFTGALSTQNGTYPTQAYRLEKRSVPDPLNASGMHTWMSVGDDAPDSSAASEAPKPDEIENGVVVTRSIRIERE